MKIYILAANLIKFCCLLFLYFFVFSSCKDPIIENTPIPPNNEDSIPVKVSKMDWWNDARYGMFIHYGIYSVLGGAAC